MSRTDFKNFSNIEGSGYQFHIQTVDSSQQSTENHRTLPLFLEKYSQDSQNSDLRHLVYFHGS